MKNLLSCIFFMLATGVLFAQQISFQSPVSLAEAGIISTQDNVYCSNQNIAGLANVSEIEIGAYYALPYGMSELSTQFIAAVFPSSLGNFSASFNQYGFSEYLEQTVNVGYSRNFGDKMSVGLAFNLGNYKLSSHSYKSQLYSSLGVQFRMSEQMLLAASLINPEQSELEYNQQHFSIPTSYNAGLRWMASEPFSVSVEVEKQVDYDFIAKLAMEYCYNNFLWLRGGMYGEPYVFTMGVGVRVSRLVFDLAFAIHNQLGNTSSFGLSYKFGDL